MEFLSVWSIVLLALLPFTFSSAKATQEGTSLTIPCSATIPNLLRYTWTKGFFNSTNPPSQRDILFISIPCSKSLIRLNARPNITTGKRDFSLNIGKVGFSDAGYYTCVAEDSVGSKVYVQSAEYQIEPMPIIVAREDSKTELKWNLPEGNGSIARWWLRGQHQQFPHDDRIVLVHQFGNDMPEFNQDKEQYKVNLPDMGLVILNAQKDDAGFYTAMKLSEGGEISYQHINVLVESAKDCQELYERGDNSSGPRWIYPDDTPGSQAQQVYCEQELDGGGWTVVQQRSSADVDFYRDWQAYKTGFGNAASSEHWNYWIGNDNLHFLTANHDQKLKIELDYHGEVAYADYNMFWVHDEEAKYKLFVSSYVGQTPPADEIRYQSGRSFSTYDNDNDVRYENCALRHHSAWWHSSCTRCNINGDYNGKRGSWTSMYWIKYKGNDGMTATRMMIKRKD